MTYYVSRLMILLWDSDKIDVTIPSLILIQFDVFTIHDSKDSLAVW